MTKKNLKEKLSEEEGQFNLLARRGNVAHIRDFAIPYQSLCGTTLVYAKSHFTFKKLKIAGQCKRCKQCEAIYLNRIK